MEKRNNNNNIDVKGRLVSGYGIVFNKLSEIIHTNNGWFKEIIEPTSITQQFLDSMDVISIFNHDENYILSRSNYGKGSLKLKVDNVGVYFEFQAPNTTIGNDLIENIKNGNVKGCSFSFMVGKDRVRYDKEQKMSIRYVERFDRIVDISPVVSPAYKSTNISVRGVKNELKEYFDKYKKMVKDLELKSYFNDIRNDISKYNKG